MIKTCASLLALLLCGCAVGPDYRRPAIDVPASFRAEAKASAASDLGWWRQLGDPVLDGYVEEALAHNDNLAAALANVQAAAAQTDLATAQFWPQINAGLGASRQRASRRNATPVPPTVPDPQTNYQGSVQASWEADVFGLLRRESEAARANALATEQARRGVALALMSQVINTYLQLRAGDLQLAIATDTAKANAESLRLFTLQFDYGQVSQMTVDQARSQYENAQSQVPQIANAITQLESALSVLLGRNPGPIARGKSIDQFALPAVPAALPSALLERRPDIMQAEQNLVAANAQIGVARAQYFPVIGLTGAYGSSSAALHNLFTGPAAVWSAASSVAAPVFHGGALQAQVTQAEARTRAAEANYRQTVRSAFADVENALSGRAGAQEQYGSQQALAASLQSYASLARLQYDNGYTAYLTVLSAEEQLLPAQLALVQARLNVLGSYVAIYKALGGDWIDAAAPAAAIAGSFK